MTSDHDNLALLIRETASGDRTAFQALYKKTSAKLFGTLLRILKREELAEDVLQEVYVLIWERAASYSAERGRPMSWMIAIARNKAIDLLRRQEERVVKLSVNEEGAGEGAALLEARLSEERVGLEPSQSMTLEYCLTEIEETSRECVLLAYQYGYSREELASRYEVPTGTVKSWLRRALQRLKDCLER